MNLLFFFSPRSCLHCPWRDRVCLAGRRCIVGFDVHVRMRISSARLAVRPMHTWTTTQLYCVCVLYFACSTYGRFRPCRRTTSTNTFRHARITSTNKDKLRPPAAGGGCARAAARRAAGCRPACALARGRGPGRSRAGSRHPMRSSPSHGRTRAHATPALRVALCQVAGMQAASLAAAQAQITTSSRRRRIGAAAVAGGGPGEQRPPVSYERTYVPGRGTWVRLAPSQPASQPAGRSALAGSHLDGDLVAALCPTRAHHMLATRGCGISIACPFVLLRSCAHFSPCRPCLSLELENKQIIELDQIQASA